MVNGDKYKPCAGIGGGGKVGEGKDGGEWVQNERQFAKLNVSLSELTYVSLLNAVLYFP